MEVAEPAVIDEELIRSCIMPLTEQGTIVEKDKREEARKQTEFHEVQALAFSFCNLAKIDNLVGLDNLVKLQLDNNVLGKIHNLAHLTNLVWLDLSFNNIHKIEGLETLTKLTDLSLYHNFISTLENMDSLVNLNVFSIGANEISSMDQLLYLRRFPNLRLINAAGNEVCNEQEYRPYIIAHVKGLQYLDYRLVEESQVAAAREQYQDELVDLEERESTDRETEARAADLAKKQAVLAEANLAGMDSLHEDIFKDDPELKKLQSLSFLSDLQDEFKENAQEMQVEFIKALQALRKTKLEEKQRWEDALGTAHLKTETVCIKLIKQFQAEKKKVVRSLRFGEMADNIKALQDLKTTMSHLEQDLMELELQQLEEESGMNNEFERRYQEHLTQTTETINQFFQKIRELESTLHDRASHEASDEVEKFTTGQLEDVTDELAALLQDKESLVNSLSASHDLRLTFIDSKEDEITTVEQQQFHTMLTEAKSNVEKRNRDRITEISIMVERHSREIAELISDEEV